MKLFLLLLLVFLLTLPSYTQTVIFEDDFESYTTNTYPGLPWVTRYSGNYALISDFTAALGEKSFKLSSQPGWARVEAYPLSTIPDRIVYEGYVYVNDANRGGAIGFGYTQPPNTYWARNSVQFRNDGQIGFGLHILQSYSAQTWYKIKVYCDFIENRGKVWIDDALLLEDAELTPREILQDFCIFPDNFAGGGEGIMYFDAIKIVDGTPEISVSVEPDMLWPPNHKMTMIKATVTVTDLIDPDPQIVLESITCNEPDNGKGDGNTKNDIQDADFGTEDYEFSLRAERSGKGEGRIYTITYTVTDFAGNSSSATATVTVSHDQDPLEPVADYEMLTNYPNPFNPETVIGFKLPEPSFVVIKIYDMLGREIRVLANENFDAGYHNVTWDGTDINGNTAPSGVYIYRIQAGDFQDTKKMILLK